MAALKGQRYQM